MRLWGIFYTDYRGELVQYMSVGFKSPALAQNEIDRIKRMQDNHSERLSGFDPSKAIVKSLFGKDFFVKEIKLKTK